ncbi:MAG: site-specific integrase [Candidatus Binataceae bacterium]|nr:site-specific integrase [Candidatus Binataceae bacterium]
MDAKLTQRLVESTSPPAAGQLFIRDTEVEGFALRVTAAGARSFVWEGRIKGRPRRLTLGKYPDLTVLLARNKAQATRSAVAAGGDPALDRQRALKAPIFKNLVADYFERHAKPHKLSWKEDEKQLRRYTPQGWYARKLSDISHDDVAKLHATVGREHGPYAANRLVRLLRTMFNLARDWGFSSDANPATRIKQFHEEKRDRFLSPDELMRVNEALAQEPNEYWRAYFVLSFLLGPRRSELLSAKWEDFDLVAGTWRLPMTKAGRSHLLPLSTPAIEILRSLLQNGKRLGVFVFAGSGKTGHLAEPKKAWHRIRTRAGVPDVRIHDLRRTLGSWLAASGYSLPLIGRALNHTNVSTTAVYARLSLDPIREALEKNAALMLAVRPQ